jgi:hypothetical protein
MRTVRVIQGVGGHQLHKIQKYLQYFVNLARDHHVAEKVTEDWVHINWKTVPHFIHKGFVKRKIYTKFFNRGLQMSKRSMET